jgi:hypothetical protein
MKAYWGSDGIAPHILDLSTRWKWVVSFTPWLLYPQGKSPWYPLDRRLGWPHSWSGSGDEVKNSQPLLGLEPPIIQSVVQCYITELSWLLLSYIMFILMLYSHLQFFQSICYVFLMPCPFIPLELIILQNQITYCNIYVSKLHIVLFYISLSLSCFSLWHKYYFPLSA